MTCSVCRCAMSLGCWHARLSNPRPGYKDPKVRDTHWECPTNVILPWGTDVMTHFSHTTGLYETGRAHTQICKKQNTVVWPWKHDWSGFYTSHGGQRFQRECRLTQHCHSSSEMPPLTLKIYCPNFSACPFRQPCFRDENTVTLDQMFDSLTSRNFEDKESEWKLIFFFYHFNISFIFFPDFGFLSVVPVPHRPPSPPPWVHRWRERREGHGEGQGRLWA